MIESLVIPCKALILGILILSSSLGLSQPPTSPYHFFGFHSIDELYPISESKRKQIKKKQIKSQEEIDFEGNKTITHFDTSGRVNYVEHFNMRSQYAQELYRYDSKGSLISHKHFEEDTLIKMDSLSYDSVDNLVSYYSMHYAPGSEPYSPSKIHDGYCVIYDIKLLSKSESEISLVDSANQQNIRKLVMNTQGDIVKIHTSNRIDSISFDTLNSNTRWVKRYWYRRSQDPSFRIGLELFYTNDLIKKKVLYETIYDKAVVLNEQYYIYNEEGLLLRIEQKNKYDDKEFFTYNYHDLPMHVIRIDRGDNIFLKKFNYSFR